MKEGGVDQTIDKLKDVGAAEWLALGSDLRSATFPASDYLVIAEWTETTHMLP